jgi:hypothetical protein
MCRPRLLFLALLIVASASGSTASAWGQTGGRVDSREAALTLANRAADALAHGEYEQAQELLRQAYEQYPAPTIAVLHARALVHLQRLALAESMYERAMLTSLPPDAPDAFRRAVEQARSESRELKARIPRLQVLVRGRAALRPQLRVTLDGHPLATAEQGRWMWVDPGRRVIRAELDGASSEQLVRVEEGQSVVVEVSEPVSQRPGYKALTFGTLGLGVVGVATGIISGIVATSAHERAVDHCPNDRCPDGQTGAHDLERFRTYRVVSTVGYAVGSAGLALGGFLLVRSAMDGPSIGLEVDRQGGRLTVGGTL